MKKFLLMFLLLALPGWSATYYLDQTSGLDSNNGLATGTAWKTINKVNISTFLSGDGISLKRGETWRELLNVPRSDLTFSDYGTGNLPVINAANLVTGWTFETPSYYKDAYCTGPKQVFDNGIRLRLVSSKAALVAGSWFWDDSVDRVYIRAAGDANPATRTIEVGARAQAIVINGGRNNITFRNLDLRNADHRNLEANGSGSGGISNIIIEGCLIQWAFDHGLSYWHNVSFGDNWLIQDSVIAFNGSNGIGLENHCTNWVIQRNSVHDNCTLLGLDYTGGIRASAVSTANVLVQDNDVFNNGILNGVGVSSDRGAGIWFDANGTGCVVRRNKTHGNNRWGIMIEKTSGVEAYFNVSYLNASGIWLSSNDLAYQVSGNHVFQNTFWGNGTGIAVSGTTGGNVVQNNLIKNNISVGNSAVNLTARFGGDNDGVMGSGNVYAFNCFGAEFLNFIQWGNGIFKSTYAAWETAYGSSTNSLQVDPLLTNPGAGDFRLQVGSPAFWTGLDVNLPPNMGAY